jgi:hypothetical protein
MYYYLCNGFEYVRTESQGRCLFHEEYISDVIQAHTLTFQFLTTEVQAPTKDQFLLCLNIFLIYYI